MTTQESSVAALEKAYRDALAKFKTDKTNKDLRRARTAAKKAWDEALLKECLESGDTGAQQMHCRDCSQMFLWTTQEQDYYRASERDWKHKPQRCRKCAESQKARRKNQHHLRTELIEETNEEKKNMIARKLGKPGKNMCYAFQKGNCPYGDLCKFNHDPEFAGKKNDDDEDESNSNVDNRKHGTSEGTKKRKIVPDVIAICKWGKACKIKKCRYRHDVGDGDAASAQSTTNTKAIHQESSEKSTNNKILGDYTAVACTPVPNKTSNATTTSEVSKKTKLMGICKWGKNCKIKRCRFQHPDDSSPSSSSWPEIEEKQKDSGMSSATPLSNSGTTTENRTASSTSAIETTKEKNNIKAKAKPKPSDKLVHKAMKKALKKAPSNKLKVKDLRKLVQKKMEGIGKDEIKIVVKETIEKNKDSMTLLEGGTFVKLLV